MIKTQDLKVGAVYLGSTSNKHMCLISHTSKDGCWIQTWLKLDNSPEVFQTDYEFDFNLAIVLMAEL